VNLSGLSAFLTGRELKLKKQTHENSLGKNHPVKIRNIEKSDRQQWNPLWQAYLVFYETSLPDHTTDLTWDRFFDSSHVFTGFVAEEDGKILGFAHAMLRQSTCEEVGELYLEDLFTIPEARGKGVGRALIDHVKDQAIAMGAGCMYWQTKAGNETARYLYDSITKNNDYVQYMIKL
jgi:GNAT superfamily N-acetyltransferase